MERRSQVLALEPRGLSRLEAAAYVGVGTTLFDDLVRDKRMPQPTHIGGRRVWDRHKLDEAFDRLNGAPATADPWAAFRA